MNEEEVRSCCHSSEFVWTRRWAWALILYPIFAPSLISYAVSVDAKHHERRRRQKKLHQGIALKLSIIIVSHACWWPWPLFLCFQLSISKSGSGYLSIPVSQKAPTPSSPRLPSLPPSLSLVTTVEVCIKTQDTDGPVLLVKGNNSVRICHLRISCVCFIVSVLVLINVCVCVCVCERVHVCVGGGGRGVYFTGH